MRVLIVKVSRPLSWYKNQVGSSFDVYEDELYDSEYRRVYEVKDSHKVIDAQDCKTNIQLRNDKMKRLT